MGMTNLSQLTLDTGPVLPPAGTGGPYTGNWYFVNATTGSDGNDGTAQFPFATLTQAQAKATANQNDVVCFQGTIHLTSSLLWAKNNVHLIGMCSPEKTGKRARISVTGSTGFDALVNVTASGCQFANFGTFYGWPNSSAALHCWIDTGGRNSYDNVEFDGFGDATVSTGSANLTGSRAFLLNTSTGETTWRNCYFGVDTTTRNATNYTLELAGGAPRLYFENCTFASYLGSSGTAAAHLLVGAAGIDRFVIFQNCTFMNAVASGASAMADGLVVNASAGGVVLLKNCTYYGITAIEAAAGSTYIDGAVPTGATSGKAVVV